MIVFSGLSCFINSDKIVIDNNVFRLHYKFTALVLISFSILTTVRQYFGAPLNCTTRDDISIRTVEAYCWAHPTFTLPEAYSKQVGVDIPYPGVGKYSPGEKKKYHSYYQWVCYVLFLQAMFFYIPRYLWKSYEKKTIESLLKGMDSPVMKDEERNVNEAALTRYLTKTMHSHKSYVAVYIFCEILNLVNVVGQVYLIDWFLGGEFMRFGIEVLKFTFKNQTDRIDPMIKVFPRITKCTFYRYGSSGDVQRHDAVCVMTLNIINEKIYIFLWFWFMTLAVLSALVLVYRFLIVVLPSTRYMVLRARAGLARTNDLLVVLFYADLGDWFVLYLLCKNLDLLNFSEVVEMLSNEFKEHKPLDNDKHKALRPPEYTPF